MRIFKSGFVWTCGPSADKPRSSKELRSKRRNDRAGLTKGKLLTLAPVELPLNVFYINFNWEISQIAKLKFGPKMTLSVFWPVFRNECFDHDFKLWR